MRYPIMLLNMKGHFSGNKTERYFVYQPNMLFLRDLSLICFKPKVSNVKLERKVVCICHAEQLNINRFHVPKDENVKFIIYDHTILAFFLNAVHFI